MAKNKLPKQKNPVGRPTDYGKRVLELTKQYLKDCKDSWDSIVESENKRTGHATYKIKQRVNFPTVAGLAFFLGVHRDTLHQWTKDHKEFSDLLEGIKQIQEMRLVNEGLSGNYSPVIAKLLLISKHGYIEKQNIEHTGKISLEALLDQADKLDDGV